MKLVARFDGEEIPIVVERHGSGYEIVIDGERHLVDVVEAGPFLRSLRMEDGSQYAVTHHRNGASHEVTFAGVKANVELIDPLARRRRGGDDGAGEAGVIDALMPGRIVRVLVAPGDAVQRGQGLLILEAMKMENEIQSPVDGVVEELFVQPGETVESGARLLHIVRP